MATTAAPASRFSGFTSPHYTQVPDELFDALMVELSGAELKVLLYIIRRTFGFKRDSDTISLSQMLGGLKASDGRQLDRGVGLTKTLLAALRTLEERGVILTERRTSAAHGNEPTSYRLHVVRADQERQSEREEAPPPLAEKLHQGGGVKITPSPRGKNYPTQETGQRKADFSKIRKAAHTVEDEANGAGQKMVPPYVTEATTGTAPPLPRGGAPEAIKATLSRLRSHLNQQSRRLGKQSPHTSLSSLVSWVTEPR